GYPPLLYGTIPPGGTATQPFAIYAYGTPGRAFAVQMQFQDDAGSYRDLVFADLNIATSPAITLDSLAITAESASPANNRPDFGELVTTAITLRNTGQTAYQDLQVIVGSPGITLANPPGKQSFGLLPSGSSATRSFDFVSVTPCATDLSLTI